MKTYIVTAVRTSGNSIKPVFRSSSAPASRVVAEKRMHFSIQAESLKNAYQKSLAKAINDMQTKGRPVEIYIDGQLITPSSF